MSDEQRGRFLDSLTFSLVSGRDPIKLLPGTKGQLVPHSFQYQGDEAIRVLSTTRGYWLEQRPPQPTSNPNKCRACEFRQLCPSSLVRA
jgi:hypothetical protein